MTVNEHISGHFICIAVRALRIALAHFLHLTAVGIAEGVDREHGGQEFGRNLERGGGGGGGHTQRSTYISHSAQTRMHTRASYAHF